MTDSSRLVEREKVREGEREREKKILERNRDEC